MSPVRVYLIPSPIGDHFTDFSFAGLRALEKVEHLFLEAPDEFLERMRTRGLIRESHHVHFLTEPDACVERASALVEEGTPFGILASSGVPCFVDPGHQIVERLLERHLDAVELVPVGMSSALDAALAMTGKDIQRFLFLGHVPECYELDASYLAHRLPLVYFVRGPAVPALLSRFGELGASVERLLLFRDIRKKGRFTLTILRTTDPPEDLVVTEDADYVVVLVPRSYVFTGGLFAAPPERSEVPPEGAEGES
ncbi:MAG: hypothetical protein ABI333_03805 [bacterium]